MKIGYLTTYDVWNRSTWPKTQVGICGAGQYLAKTLEEQAMPLDYIGPLAEKLPLQSKLKWHLYRQLLGRDYYPFTEPSVLQAYADQILGKLSGNDLDIVLCPENAIPIAYLDYQQPIVLWTDAPLASSVNFYPWLSNLCNETKQGLYAMEKAAFDRCELIIFLSDWAAEMAVNIYEIHPSKMRVIPWGANIECDRTSEDIENMINARNISPCKLLFIGIDWFRKGGNVAFQVAQELNQRGLETELTVMGCNPFIEEVPPSFVRILGFVNKYSELGRTQMNQLFSESHFLILPSTADFSPHVLCEANSFGLPCLTTDVGGIPTLIKNDLNGKTFSAQASISEYCDYITHLIKPYQHYKELAMSSFNEYQSRLNWSVAAKSLKRLLTDLL